MKILLLGAGGQLGKEWDRFLEKKNSTLTYIACNSGTLDITDSTRLEKAFQSESPGLVINCAAYTRVDMAEEESAKAQLVNAEAVENIAKLCTEWNARLVHYSTDYVFSGRTEDRVRFPDGYPEDHPADPINVYGQSKWEGEQAIRRSGCRHLIIRVSWLCGQYGNNFVKTMLRLAEEKSSLDIVDDQWGSPSFADNIVLNTFNLIEEEAEGTYHLTSYGLITWADFAEAVFSLANKHMKVNRITSGAYPVKARRPFFSKLDTAKVGKIPGAKLEDWETGLERLIRKLENR